jgi:hypothetical protein
MTYDGRPLLTPPFTLCTVLYGLMLRFSCTGVARTVNHGHAASDLDGSTAAGAQAKGPARRVGSQRVHSALQYAHI